MAATKQYEDHDGHAVGVHITAAAATSDAGTQTRPWRLIPGSGQSLQGGKDDGGGGICFL